MARLIGEFRMREERGTFGPGPAPATGRATASSSLGEARSLLLCTQAVSSASSVVVFCCLSLFFFLWVQNKVYNLVVPSKLTKELRKILYLSLDMCREWI